MSDPHLVNTIGVLWDDLKILYILIRACTGTSRLIVFHCHGRAEKKLGIDEVSDYGRASWA
jgi:hypothetical protein